MTERSKRDGIYPAGDGRWRITVGGGRDPLTGKYVRLRETIVGTRTDAKRRRDELRVQVARGVVVHADRETVADYLERWITHREHIGKVRPATARAYRGHIRREVVSRIGSMRLADVRPAHVQRVLDDALEGGRSSRTVTQVHRIMHAAFKQAVRWQSISSNPSDGATPPKLEQARLRTPAPEDVLRLLEQVDERYRGPLTVAAMTGLRRGEILALRWSAIDLDVSKPVLKVEGTLQRGCEGLVIMPPKTERSERTVPLPPSVAAMLRRTRTEQLERRILAGPAWREAGFVFDRGSGSPLDPDTFTKAVHAAVLAAGLEGVRLHDMRHAWASMQIEAGTGVRTVSDQLGHATVGFTLQTYVHTSDAAAAAAADTTERLLGSVVD